MKKAGAAVIALLCCLAVCGQDLSNFRLYDPAENAEQKLADAIAKAKAAGKHVFVQIGGNWCIWCARFHQLATTDKSIDSVISANFVVYHLNYSKENRNEKLMARFGYPQRFGFPVFLILDGDGRLLHIQNTVYLEDGKGYNVKTVTGFLTDWSPAAIDPKTYKTE